MKFLCFRWAITSFLLLYASTVQSQTTPYKFAEQIDSTLKQNKAFWRYQAAATDYSLIGEYKTMLSTWDLDSNTRLKVPFTEAMQKELSAYKPESAIKYILEKAKHTRVIIINEAHQQPRHRKFVSGLLPELRKLGYNQLGLEAMGRDDSLLHQRGYPILTTGYYIREPRFGNMIRTALQEGYTCFAYEAKPDQQHEQREIQQAINIHQRLQAHPNDKFIIYVGFDHAVEDSIETWGLSMAGRLKQMTGIDPLTIDQTELTERSDQKFENSFRKILSAHQSVVWKNAAGDYLNTPAPKRKFDAAIYHPNTKMRHGRPNWLFSKDMRPVKIPTRLLNNEPSLLFAYAVNEDPSRAVPLDIIYLENKKTKKKLAIRKELTQIRLQVLSKAGSKKEYLLSF